MGDHSIQQPFSATYHSIGTPGSFRQINSIRACEAMAERGMDEIPALRLRLGRDAGSFDASDLHGIHREWTQDGGSTTLVLRAATAVQSTLFVSLCDDLCTRLSHCESGEQVQPVLIHRLEQWQEFLKACRPEGLSPEAQAGLFAELWFLLECLKPLVGVRAAVEAWRGHTRATHDFQLPGCAIEVKSSRRDLMDTVTIGGAAQLVPPDGAHLLLSAIHLSTSGSGGTSLPDLVGELRSAMDIGAGDVVEEALRNAGYLDSQAEAYHGTLYSIRRERRFEVRDGFPRITPDQVPDGCSGLKYKVNLAVAATAGLEVEDGSLAPWVLPADGLA